MDCAGCAGALILSARGLAPALGGPGAVSLSSVPRVTSETLEYHHVTHRLSILLAFALVACHAPRGGNTPSAVGGGSEIDTTWRATVVGAADSLRACLARRPPMERPWDSAAALPVCACAKHSVESLQRLACAAGPNFLAFRYPDDPARAIAFAPDSAPAVFAGGAEQLRFDSGAMIWVYDREPAPVAPWYTLRLALGVD